MKKSLLVVVALLCMASLMAAMAYTSATVTSAAQMRVTSTDMALLRFDNVNNKFEVGYTTGVKDGELWFDFTQGKVKNGFQPNSVYTYKNLFRIMNNQDNANIKITAETDIPYLWLYDREGNCLIENGESTGKTSSGNTYYTVEFRIPSGANTKLYLKDAKIEFTSVSEAKNAN